MTTERHRLGILGGTFDPVHHGHLIVASELRAALRLDRVLLVPNARSPFKSETAMSGATHRKAMLDLVAAETPWLEVSTVELDRGGVSYTIDTLRSIRAALPAAELIFLMGADSLVDFHRWREPDRILQLAEIGVALRPSATVGLDAVIARLPAAEGRVTVVPTPLIEIAATDIRARARMGRPISFHVPRLVEGYIQDHRLYAD